MKAVLLRRRVDAYGLDIRSVEERRPEIVHRDALALSIIRAIHGRDAQFDAREVRWS